LQTPPNKFAHFELGRILGGYSNPTIKSVLVGDSLRITTTAPYAYDFGFLGKRSIEIRPDSGEIAYFEAVMCVGLSIGLANFVLIRLAGDRDEHGVLYASRWLGYAPGGFGWNVNGYIHSSMDGVVCACRIPDLEANAGDRMGLMVDCSSDPTIRFFVNSCQVHHLCVGEEGYQDWVFPAFHLQNADGMEIISNPELPHI